MLKYLNLSDIKFFLLGCLPVLFYFISHLSMLDGSVKFLIYALVLGFISLFLFLFSAREIFFKLKYKRSIVLIGFSALIVFVYSWIFPPLYEYGVDKVYYIYVVLLLLSYTIVCSFLNKNTMTGFIFLLFLSSVFYCFLSVFLGVDENNARKSSIGLNPTIMAKMCIISAAYCSVYMFFQKKINIFYFVFLLFSIFAVFKTGSRGPLLAYGFSFLLLYLVRNGISKALNIIIAIPIVYFLFSKVIQFLPEDLSKRYSMEAISVEENSDDGDRVQLWETASDIIANNSWGIGSGNFLDYSFIAVPHNIILEIGVEYGVLFMILFSILLVLSAIYAVVALRRDNSFINNFMFLLFFMQIVNSLLGGDLSIQAYLLYVCMAYFLFSYNKQFVRYQSQLRKLS
ncbi:TPA: O-antigen ligase family protein [Acinetobacter baumannii]|uniref:O-antigen ligase family protein n=1 Tax=Acinetobacter baumannii TaxID=470 RepID=UPI0010C7EBD4|nr:O-antigen ligase family protein [Acinetobacter baumannii]MDC4781642.1 O-antigen ligase family protein [Acinetobacter baumannii]MDC4804212.1 O-antigen ligase family protein [Acinetobacter baumannii]MDC5538655.1 O-antigen ligase family protein [Acinetobacter baumannii]QCP37540.1 O-antigen ligase family protein [Acinetobacter baumannii]HCW4112133.1 O-antigen ligase family protein [Acinetobacter baumannii]